MKSPEEFNRLHTLKQNSWGRRLRPPLVGLAGRLGLCLAAIPALGQSQEYYLDLESAFLTPVTHTLVDNGRLYPSPEQGTGIVHPYLTEKDYRRGSHSLALEVEAVAERSQRQRNEISWVRRDIIRFGETYYTGFSFKLDVDSLWLPDGEAWTMIMQWWQCHAYSPPLDVNLYNNGGKLWIYSTGRDSTHWYEGETGTKGREGTHFEIWDRNFESYRGRWVDLVLGYRFDPGGDGWVKIWFNRDLAKEFKGKLGMPEALMDRLTGKPCVQYIPEHKFGVYRKGQSVGVKVLYDELRFGRNFEEVALPGEPQF